MYTDMKLNLYKYLAATFAALMALTLGACGQGDSVSVKVADARARNDGPALWKVTDHDSTLYLFGTVHLLPDEADWQRRDMQAAFDEVGTIYFEVPDGDKANFEASVLQTRYGRYESGERLSDHLDGLAQKRLMAAAYNVDIQPTALEFFKPWIVADMLSLAAAEAEGLLPENSADAVLRLKARKAKKVIKSLDDMKTYIEAVALLPDGVQIRSLEDTIKNFDAIGSDIKTVNAAWIVGNTDVLISDMMEPAKVKSPEMFATLFTKRNAKWVNTLDAFMQGDDNAMVVVGIGHLLGEDGLPERLKEQGYTVERVRRFDLPN